MKKESLYELGIKAKDGDEIALVKKIDRKIFIWRWRSLSIYCWKANKRNKKL